MSPADQFLPSIQKTFTGGVMPVSVSLRRRSSVDALTCEMIAPSARTTRDPTSSRRTCTRTTLSGWRARGPSRLPRLRQQETSASSSSLRPRRPCRPPPVRARRCRADQRRPRRPLRTLPRLRRRHRRARNTTAQDRQERAPPSLSLLPFWQWPRTSDLSSRIIFSSAFAKQTLLSPSPRRCRLITPAGRLYTY